MSQCNERMEWEEDGCSSSRNSNQEISEEPIIHNEANQRFNMNHAEKSIALIFLNIHFDIPDLQTIIGADHNERVISNALESIGFEVRPYIDLTWKEMENILLEAAKENHRNRDCLLVYIMTHGEGGGSLYAKDEAYKVDQVWEKFKPEKAKSLIGKPKIFILDACRGHVFEKRLEMSPLTPINRPSNSPSNEQLPSDKSEVPSPGNSDEDDTENCGEDQENKSTKTNSTKPPSSPFPSGSLILPYNADFLIAYSAVEGSISVTTKDKGTWLVQDFCRELTENVYKMNFMTILTRTLGKVVSRIDYISTGYIDISFAQMPVFISTLTRDLYFINKSCSASSDQGTLSEGCIRIKEDLERYKMNHEQRGTALVFNHIHFIGRPWMQRFGAESDQKAISETLTSIGFDVRLHVDLRRKEIEDELKKVAEEDHSNSDCLLVVIMTHGEENGMLHAADVLYHVEDVWNTFKPTETKKTLVNKPKIFLFQACRGDDYEKNAAVPDAIHASFEPEESPDSERSITLPSSADFLIAFSTMKGYVSFRNPWKGTWFIQDFCKELRENVHKRNFLSILTRTLRRVAYSRSFPSNHQKDKGRQMPVFTSTLRKKLYFYDKPE